MAEASPRELMADFGEVMVEIQLFEMALLGLAMSRGYTPERVGTDDWREHVEQLFAMSAGQLLNAAQIEEADLAERLKSTIELSTPDRPRLADPHRARPRWRQDYNRQAARRPPRRA